MQRSDKHGYIALFQCPIEPFQGSHNLSMDQRIHISPDLEQRTTEDRRHNEKETLHRRDIQPDRLLTRRRYRHTEMYAGQSRFLRRKSVIEAARSRLNLPPGRCLEKLESPIRY
jgi:hypothetical protein